MLDKICRTKYEMGVIHYTLKSDYYSHYDPYYVKSETCNSFDTFTAKEFKIPYPLPVLNRYNRNIVNIIFTKTYDRIIVDTIKTFPDKILIIEPVVWMIIVKIQYFQAYRKIGSGCDDDDCDRYKDSMHHLEYELQDERVVDFFNRIMLRDYIKPMLNYILNFFRLEIECDIYSRKITEIIMSRVNRFREKKEFAVEKYPEENGDSSYSYYKENPKENLVIPIYYQGVISLNNRYKRRENENKKYQLFKVNNEIVMNIYYINVLEYQTASNILTMIKTEDKSFFSSVDIEKEEYLIPSPLCYVFYNMCLLVPVEDEKCKEKRSGDKEIVIQQWNFNGTKLQLDAKSTAFVPLFFEKLKDYKEVMICLTTTFTDLLYKLEENDSYKINGYELKCLLFNSQYFIWKYFMRNSRKDIDEMKNSICKDSISMLLHNLFECKDKEDIYNLLKKYLLDNLLSSYMKLNNRNLRNYERIVNSIDDNHVIIDYLFTLLHSNNINKEYISLRDNLLSLLNPHFQLVHLISSCFSTTKEDIFIPKMEMENVINYFKLFCYDNEMVKLFKIEKRDLLILSKNHLIDIPSNPNVLQSIYKENYCDNCKMYNSNGICLICGKRLCLGKYCCRSEEKGEGIIHSENEHNNLGMYLSLTTYDVYLVRDKFVVKYLNLYDNENENEFHNKMELLKEIFSKDLIVEKMLSEKMENKLKDNCL